MSFEIRLVKDKPEARGLWQSLTPGETIYDDWDFRNTFNEHYKNELFFYAGYESGKLVCLMPLERSDNGEHLQFFGGDYMEDNRVFAKPGFEKHIPDLYKNLKEKAHLEFIRGTDSYTQSFPVVDYKYVMPLTFTDSYGYIETHYEGETRKKFRKRFAKMEEEATVQIVIDYFEDLELMVAFNIEQFKDGPIKSMFGRPGRLEIFKSFLQPHETFRARLLTFVVNGEKQAVSMALIHKDTYASINTGVIGNPAKNLKEYIRLKKFDDAIGQGCKLFDAFVRDYGWKEKWGFHKIPQYIYPV